MLRSHHSTFLIKLQGVFFKYIPCLNPPIIKLIEIMQYSIILRKVRKGILTMGNSVSRSFTEYFIQHRWALDVFSPYPYEPTKLESKENSVYLSFADANINPFSSCPKPQNELYNKIRLVLTTPLRVSYIALSVLYISRIGVLFHGGMFAISLLRFSIARVNTAEIEEKVKQHGFALVQDLFFATFGALTVKLIAESIFNLTYIAGVSPKMGRAPLPQGWRLLASTLFSTSALVGSAALLILTQTPYGAAQFHARPEERCGLYLSFLLRNQLGIVDQKGGLLPFSKKDVFLDEKQKHFNNKFLALLEMTCNAELELIELVAEANRNLERDKILFEHPFNPKKVVSQIDQHLNVAPTGDTHSLTEAQPLVGIRSEILIIGKKIDVLLDLITSVKEFSFNFSWIGQIGLALGNREVKNLTIKREASMLTPESYQTYFRAASQTLPREGSETVNLKDLKVFANPKFSSRPQESKTFDCLHYDLYTHISQNKDEISLEAFGEIVGLTSTSKYSDFKRSHKKYALALHPDKQKETQKKKLAEALFKIYGEFHKSWEKRYFKKGNS